MQVKNVKYIYEYVKFFKIWLVFNCLLMANSEVDNLKII